MNAFKDLCETEGIIPAIESSHAVAGAYKAAADLKGAGDRRAGDDREPLRTRGQGTWPRPDAGSAT